MSIFSLLIFSVILLCALPILVPILNAIQETARKKQAEEHTTEQTAYITTYQNENISNDDIMTFFVSQILLYFTQYTQYLSEYKVYSDPDKQNYAWYVKTTKKTYNWATIVTIKFHFSNGWFCLEVADKQFNSGGKSSRYNGNSAPIMIDSAFAACRQESMLMWKQNNMFQKTNIDTPFPLKALDPDDYQENYQQAENITQKNSNSYAGNKNIPDDISRLLRFFNVEYPNTDLNLLKRNYHNELSKCHPDKVAHLGDDLKKFASQKTIEIIANYNILINWLKEHGT